MPKRIYEFGEIVRAPIQYTDGSTDEVRPGVIVSSREYNAASRDVVIAAVTSRLHQAKTFGVVIPNWKDVGLTTESVIKPVFSTIILTDISQSLGRLDPKTRNELKIQLGRIFGFRTAPSS